MDEQKAELARRWLRKASHDLAAARLLGRSNSPLLDMAMCHCQYAAEKALNGYPRYYDEPIEDTRNVVVLAKQAMVIEPGFVSWLEASRRPSSLAGLYQYPGLKAVPSLEDDEEAVDDAETIVRQVLALLPPDVQALKASP